MVEGTFKFLGVTCGHGSRGDYYNISLHCNGSDPLKIRCDEQVYNDGMRIEWGADVICQFHIGMYQGSSFIRCVKITDVG